MVWIGTLFVVVGWCLVALSMATHQMTVFGRMLAARSSRLARASGFGCMAIAFALFARVQGWEQGPVFWTLAVMLGALATGLGLTVMGARRRG
jgi:hypothetical protein